VIGAGAAGLAASRDLAEAGRRVLVLEARDRIGGRIFTRRLPDGTAIELGPEFVHGRSPEIWGFARDRGIALQEVGGMPWARRGGVLIPARHLAREADVVLDRMTATDPDRSFREFLETDAQGAPADAKRRATGFVEGFNAADASRISVRWLVESREADDKIDGDRQYRFAGGYDALALVLRAPACEIRLGAAVREVTWSEGAVEIATTAGVFRAPRAIVTLPLGVLQAGDVRFTPALDGKREALGGLAMGPVIKIVLVFRERFWSHLVRGGESLEAMSFLFGDDATIPTWWTRYPDGAAVLTGWLAGPRTDILAGRPADAVLWQAIESLAALFELERTQLERLLDSWHLHDWIADPWSRGAYSWVVVGGAGAPRELGRPLAGTLFFAGEATDVGGHNGTVHGAIASGRRAAREVLEAAK